MKKILVVTLLTFLFTNAFPVQAQSTAQQPVARAIMFWMSGCAHCEDVIQNVLPPLREKHGSQFELLMIEVVDTEDIEMLLSVAASYGIPKEQAGVPFLIMGDMVLVGSDQVREQLPAGIDDFLAAGGVDWPSDPLLKAHLGSIPSVSRPTSKPAAVEEASPAPEDTSGKPVNNGFTLAIGIMLGMIAAIVYSIIAFINGRTYTLQKWADWLVPALILSGIAVASYLSYIETQSVKAICGPVGDCNAVQQSPYAKLFGILPIGILGLVGYIGMLALWIVRKYSPKFEKLAAIGFFSMAFFAVIFSVYLTYLEPFVIKAVCIWCLSSAVLVTLLLLLGIPSAIHQFTPLDEGQDRAGSNIV